MIVLSDAAAPLLAGAQGILQIPRPEIGSFVLSTPVSLFYLTLAASLVAAYVAWRLERVTPRAGVDGDPRRRGRRRRRSASTSFR